MNLTGKVVAVTGAGQGIGRAIARQLAREGAHVALMDINPETLEIACSDCVAYGVQATTYVVNVSDEKAVESAFVEIAGRYKRLDGLVNNAGIVRDSLLLKAKDGDVLSKMSLAQWNKVVDVNLTGAFLCGREAACHMVRFGEGGVIVNMSSLARHGNVGQSNYSAAKAGVATLTAVWAAELGRYGIRVGAVAPGFTRTEILSGIPTEVLEKVLDPVPLKRLGEVDEIAHGVRFIFENDFFTGRCLDVDGGRRM